MSPDDSKVDRHWLVFTGHRIDEPGRAEPRFPLESEPRARESILHAVEDEISRIGRENLRAISSAASGGDIIFLECCAALEIPAELYLALSKDEFARASVADAGDDWVRRFDALCARFPVHVLESSPTQDLNVWQQTNLWMLDIALGPDRSDTTVIALWDGQEGDGDGGTKDMVDRAREAGARVVRIDLPKPP